MVHALNLVDDGVQHSVLLAQDAGAGEVCQGGGVSEGGIAVDHQAVFRGLVGLAEVDGLAALLGVGHAGDDHVDLALVQRLDEAAPAQLHNHQLSAQVIGDVAGDLHVVAVGVEAGQVLDGHVQVGGGVLLPVVGGVGTFHADADLGNGGSLVGGFGGGRFGGSGRIFFLTAAGAQGQDHSQGQQQGGQISSRSSHGSRSFLFGKN